jgi:hypothetical protein
MTLPDYIAANLTRPFVWGSHDCILFGFGWVNQQTGRDWLAEFTPWKTPKQAMRIVKRLSGLEAAFDARFTRINPNLARDGDIALYNGCMCLFSGPHIVGPGPDGMTFVNRLRATCAWHY